MVSKKQVENYLGTLDEVVSIYEGSGLRFRLQPGRRGVQTDEVDNSGRKIWKNVTDSKEPVKVSVQMGRSFIVIDALDFITFLNNLIKQPLLSGAIDYWAEKQLNAKAEQLGLKGSYESPFAKLGTS